ncbi:MAG: MaoC family dehydratase [Mycobacterium sp.]
MSNAERLTALAHTAKQREFECDFVATWEDHATWDAAVMRQPTQIPGEFVVEEEDVLAYNRALGETDPLLVDPDYAREHAPGGVVVAHPLFATAVAFWLSRPGTICSWIRTPGARNPFQHLEIHEPIRVGDRLTATMENSDRFIRRGQHYLTAHVEVRDQRGMVKVEFSATLILPANRDQARRFATALTSPS